MSGGQLTRKCGLVLSSSNSASLARLRPVLTRSISPENFDGSPGGGGRATEGTGAEAARDLGQGWKVSPSVDVKAGETFTLADIDSAGVITHIWITTHTRSEEHTSELQSRGQLV